MYGCISLVVLKDDGVNNGSFIGTVKSKIILYNKISLCHIIHAMISTAYLHCVCFSCSVYGCIMTHLYLLLFRLTL